MSEEGDPEGGRDAVVLDYLPHGRADDDRPQYQKPSLAHALGRGDFGLYELELETGGSFTIGEVVSIEPRAEAVEAVRRIGFDDLSGGARSELEHAIRDLVDGDEARFVEFFNEAGPITLRLHQLNLLPGIGDKLRDTITDAREREPFESLDDLQERIAGLHDPRETVVERILDEVRDDDVKYKLFVRPPDQ